MEIVTAIVTPVVQSLMVPVKKHLGYLISCTKYVTDMGTKMHQLEAKRLGVENHMNHNKSNNLEVPTEVRGWLEQVAEIDAQVKSIPSDDVGSCFNLKHRHKIGRKAFKIIEEINRAIDVNNMINWSDRPIPLGKVDSMKPSTSTPSTHHNDFKSRELTFMEALRQLQPNHKSQMIALCGMGGVGKTTMMEKLKKAVAEKKIFDFIVEATIGEKTDPIVIQQSVADFLGVDLKESTKAARAIKLQKCFKDKSDGGKKILVILDDVWELVDLNDIGLSPFPNQGVGFKVLLTSRIRDVCTCMGVTVDSIFNVETIKDQEAQSFFHQCATVPEGDDLDFDLCEIGDDIASRCHGLPMAIKTIASYLKCYRSDKWVWEDALSRLKDKKVDEVVHQIFEISYNHLQNEEIRSTLLLCGLFPEDFDTPREDLVRYGWGLRLFNNVHSIREARNRLNTYIEQLINANLLIRSQLVNHVKMHDLVRAFVLKVCSNIEHASIIGDISKLTQENMSKVCKRISLTCSGMSEFPRNFKFPNILLLKLMHGDESLKFPEDFYGDMNELQVIAYDKIEYPLLSRSFQCCTKLRTLCLSQCSLMLDCSSIGNLSNLEVLSFAKSGIRKLPSTIGNLRELKLLDLTDCRHLCINDGVLKSLVKLEELYMSMNNKKGIRFDNDKAFDELVECSKNLTALEIEFFDKYALPKNMSSQKIERFKISIGYHEIREWFHNWNYEAHLSGNVLCLVTNKDKILESIVHDLLKKTEVLLLKVADMSDLEKMSLHPLQDSSFRNLRVLKVYKCVHLRYLFTLGVAKTLSKLEYLEVTSCQYMKELIHNENGGLETIQFPKLKYLYLHYLPSLLSLCNTMNVVKLPQLIKLSLDRLLKITSIYSNNKLEASSTSSNISETQHVLIEQVEIPKLEKLYIFDMKNLNEIWPCEFEQVDDCILREIIVDGCESLVNLFPSNPMLLPHHLEELTVKKCGSVEVLFNIDLGCVGKNEEVGSCLRRIVVDGCGSLVNLFPSNPMLLLHHLEELTVKNCGSVEVLFNIDMGCVGKNEEVGSCLRRIVVDGCGSLVNLFPSNPMLLLHHLQELTVNQCGSVEVLFNIDLGCVGKNEEVGSCLRRIKVSYADNLREVWRIKGANDNGLAFSGFQAIESLEIWGCKRFRNVFTPTTTNFDMISLTTLVIRHCGQSVRGDEKAYSSSRQGQEINVVSFPSYLIHSFHNLHKLHVDNYKGMEVKVVFWIESPTSREQQPLLLPYLKSLELEEMECMSHVWRCNWSKFLTPQKQQTEESFSSFHNLTTISLDVCKNIKYLFSPLMAELLSNLKNISIKDCDAIEEVVSNRDDDDEDEELVASTSTNTSTSLFPHLEDIYLDNLPNLKCIGDASGAKCVNDQSKLPQVNDVAWSLCQYSRRIEILECEALPYVIPSYALEQMQKLEKLAIRYCESLVEVFEAQGFNINGGGTTNVDEGSAATIVIQRIKKINVPQLYNLKELMIYGCHLLQHVFTFSTLESLTQLKKLSIINCKAIKVIVKEDNGEQITISFKVVLFPRLKSIELEDLPNLTGFYLGKNEFKWPLLDDVMIDACPRMMVFTCGCSITPKLNYIHTKFGTYSLECGLNFPVMAATLHESLFSSLDTTNSCATTSEAGTPWSFHNLIEINVKNINYGGKNIIPSDELRQLQKLEKIHVRRCYKVEEVFEALEGTDSSELQSVVVVEIPKLREVELVDMWNLKYIWKNNPWMVLEFPNLTKLSIRFCNRLEHVFSSSMVGSLLQLQDLYINNCKDIEVIVKEANVAVEEGGECDDKVNGIIMLPHLKSLKLLSLPSLKGFYLGKEDFTLPSLDTLDILACPAIRVFTKGHLATPELRVIDTSFGRCELAREEDLNSFINTKQQEGLSFGQD